MSGPQYAKILQASGLGRYITAQPPDTDTIAITNDEMVRFTQTVYQMLGEDVFRLFLRNFGHAL